MVDFTGVRLKIERARRQTADLNDAMEIGLGCDGYVIHSERDPRTGDYVYSVHKLPALDPQWSVIVGEILFNLRSALDHFAWQLLLLDGGEPDERTHFPIKDDPFNDKGKLRLAKIPHLKDPKFCAAVEEVQPYHGMDGVPIFDEHPLRRLQLTNNWDKHRLLLLAVQVLDLGSIYWAGNETDPSPVRWAFARAPLKEGSEVARFNFGDQERPPNFHPNLELQVAIEEPLESDGSRTRLTLLSDLLKELDWGVVQYALADKFWHLLPAFATTQLFPGMATA